MGKLRHWEVKQLAYVTGPRFEPRSRGPRIEVGDNHAENAPLDLLLRPHTEADMQSQRRSQSHPLGTKPTKGMSAGTPHPTASQASSRGVAVGGGGSHLDHTAVLHNVAVHLFVLRVVLLLLHLGCMLRRHIQGGEARPPYAHRALALTQSDPDAI